MARIRTIKPEFPQSESMGRVSREARLTFILLWTLVDDEGRTRGNSRMLASLLFPYDDDASGKIDGWLTELEAEQCIQRFKASGDSYIQVCNWLNHQKIDRPSKSKIPAPSNARDNSRVLDEASSLDQGSRIKDQGPGGEQSKPPPSDLILVAFDNYNTIARDNGLPPAEKLTPKRRALLEAILASQGIDGWNRALTAADESDFLKGMKPGCYPANIDWFLNEDNLQRALEGAFND